MLVRPSARNSHHGRPCAALDLITASADISHAEAVLRVMIDDEAYACVTREEALGLLLALEAEGALSLDGPDDSSAGIARAWTGDGCSIPIGGSFPTIDWWHGVRNVALQRVRTTPAK